MTTEDLAQLETRLTHELGDRAGLQLAGYAVLVGATSAFLQLAG